MSTLPLLKGILREIRSTYSDAQWKQTALSQLERVSLDNVAGVIRNKTDILLLTVYVLFLYLVRSGKGRSFSGTNREVSGLHFEGPSAPYNTAGYA